MARGNRTNRDPAGTTARATDEAGKPAGSPQPKPEGVTGTDTITSQTRLDIATGPVDPTVTAGYAPPPSDETNRAKRDGDTRTKPLQHILADDAIQGDVPAHVHVNIPVGSEPTSYDTSAGKVINDPETLGAAMGQEEPDDEREQRTGSSEDGDGGDDTAQRMGEQKPADEA